MHRFYLPPNHCAGETLRLDGREAHHALHVLRLKHGELVTVLDGIGNEFMCTVKDAGRNAVTLSVSLKNFVPAPPCSVTLLVGVPKGKIIESIIQKAVELGARRIVPILSERVVTHLDDDAAETKRDKWQNVAIEAIKQCGAAWLPKVEAPTSIVRFPISRFPILNCRSSVRCKRNAAIRAKCCASLKQKTDVCRKASASGSGRKAISRRTNCRRFKNSGAQPISLGNLVLRVETAAIYCLSILNYELNR